MTDKEKQQIKALRESGESYAQDHILKNRDGNKMTAQDIMTMDWLADNVV